MYLIIFEDGELNLLRELSEDEKSASDSGIFDIIDVGDNIPKQYYQNDWHPIEEF